MLDDDTAYRSGAVKFLGTNSALRSP